MISYRQTSQSTVGISNTSDMDNMGTWPCPMSSPEIMGVPGFPLTSLHNSKGMLGTWGKKQVPVTSVPLSFLAFSILVRSLSQLSSKSSSRQEQPNSQPGPLKQNSIALPKPTASIPLPLAGSGRGPSTEASWRPT